DLEDILIDGVIQTQQMTGRALIEALAPIYFFDGVERDGKIVFVRRGGASAVTIPDDDLAAHADSEDVPALDTVKRANELELPSQMVIQYLNLGADYQVGSQIARRMAGGSSDVVTVNAPVVLTDAHAKAIVDTWLYSAYFERDEYTWYTTRKYVKYEPTDVVTVGGKLLRITEKTEGTNGVITWKGVPSSRSLASLFAQAG